MIRHTGERWALDAGEEPDILWCPSCREWVGPEWDIDEDNRYNEWCPFCGGEVTEEPEEEEEDDIPVG